MTSPTRTLIDLAARIAPRYVEEALEAGLRSGVVTAQELEDQLGRSKGRRGVAILRRYLVLDLQSLARAKSHLEGRFLRFCEEEGLPAPEVNAFLGGYEVDASWPGTKVIVELDSWSFHRSRAAFERDRAKSQVGGPDSPGLPGDRGDGQAASPRTSEARGGPPRSAQLTIPSLTTPLPSAPRSVPLGAWCGSWSHTTHDPHRNAWVGGGGGPLGCRPVFAYDPTEWTDLFVASAGASAALAGLVFVAVSINIDRILKLPGVPERALATVLLLLGAVVVSITCLIPGQSLDALGVELLAEGAIFGLLTLRHSIASLPNPEHISWLLSRVIVAAIGTLPFAIGGASLLAESGGGLYWIAGGIIGATVGAVASAWVLLVEILR